MLAEVKFIDNVCASRYQDGVRKPIRIGDKHPFQPNCRQLDEEWKARLACGHQRWFSGHPLFVDLAKEKPRLLMLRNALVEFGGEEVCLPGQEEDLEKLLSRGQIWNGRAATMMKGGVSQCHSNSCYLWEANQDKLYLATGYALSDDGLWRQHSWCILPRARSIQIVETTVRRELYFGFVMTLEETLAFGNDNTDFGLDLHEDTKLRYQPEDMQSKKRGPRC